MKQPTSRHSKKHTFNAVMTQARTHMHPVQKVWSRIIHLRPLDAAASLLGSTLARPMPILTGAIGSSLTILLLYGTAKTYGYSLSGFEGVAGFLAGWIAGYIIELIRAMVRGGSR